MYFDMVMDYKGLEFIELPAAPDRFSDPPLELLSARDGGQASDSLQFSTATIELPVPGPHILLLCLGFGLAMRRSPLDIVRWCWRLFT